MNIFRNRVDAGQQLVRKLRAYHERDNTLVLALPRGGVPVAVRIARMLKLPLDVWVVRKLGAPDQPELAMGAIASGGALLEYLRAANKTPLKHLDRMALYTADDYVFISPAAHYGLELEEVLKTLDLTQTSMGHRLFRFWLFHQRLLLP